MPTPADILWFKQEFADAIGTAVQGTPFDVDMITAIACQETGYIWRALRKKGLSTADILALCVGDTLDASAGRKAFPRTKAELVSRPQGAQMFAIARRALVDLAEHMPDYRGAARRPDKFCHGFGMFQYDLQFFKTDPDYFLQQRYRNFADTLRKCRDELKAALKRMGWQGKTALSDVEMACVGIAYNTGRFNPKKGLKQGHFSGGKYYGEHVFDFLRLARTVGMPGSPADLPVAQPGAAVIAAPSLVLAAGRTLVVDTKVSTLRLRSAPKISKPPTANVIGELPEGHLVRVVTGTPVNTFLEVETSLAGALLHGFASASYLKPASQSAVIPVNAPAATPPVTGIVAVHMPRKAGHVTRRAAPAGPHSLNEPSQPQRKGTSADALRAELAAIVDWLAVDKPAHRRYQPQNGLTYCNIYAHDYCHLAGVYLPRVWWTQKAIEQLAQGKTVAPLYGHTIDEMRANDLFRWLRDFGDRFGWRQTGTLSKLQTEVNQGAVGLIVARRKQDGRSGHIVAVVPESEDLRARRDNNGDVIAPLQSQAGASNFRFGTGKANWWGGGQFAESAFWLHA